MIVQAIDFTSQFNASNTPYYEVGGFDYAVVQFITPTGTVTFQATNDDTKDGIDFNSGSAQTAENPYTLMGTNLTTGTGVTTINASGAVRFERFGRFLGFSKTSVTAAKVIIYLYRIS